MKPGLLAIIIVLANFETSAQQKFDLLWEDNFDSSQINYSRWNNNYSWGRTIVNNHELEYYTDGKNLELKNGTLNIIGRKESIAAQVDSSSSEDKLMNASVNNLRVFQYPSGMLRSQEKFHYGKFEIRCKLPKGNGTWPAFWLYGGACGEIDIFEKAWKFHYGVTNNLHYDSSGIPCGDFRFAELESRNTFSKAFHTYSIEWTRDTLQWFIDDNLVRTAVHAYSNCPMELIINLALADDDFWGHTPTRKNWQSVFEIDYVKVWRLKDHP